MSSKEAFIDIIRANEGLIYKVAKVYTNSREDEQDLYQEIVYQLWKSFDSFRHESKVSTWMYRVALNTSIAHLSKHKKRGNQLPIEYALLSRVEQYDPLTEERIGILYAQIKNLDTVEKGLILLYLEGKNYEEIASITGFTATNVGTRLSRIKQKLKSQIIK